jgi:hypothetical protein
VRKNEAVTEPLCRLDLVVHRAWRTDVMKASSFQVYHLWCFPLEDADRVSLERGETVRLIEKRTTSQLRFGRVENLVADARCSACGFPIKCRHEEAMSWV